MQVRAADRRRRDLHDRVALVEDLRVRDLAHLHLLRSHPARRFHRSPPLGCQCSRVQRAAPRPMTDRCVTAAPARRRAAPGACPRCFVASESTISPVSITCLKWRRSSMHLLPGLLAEELRDLGAELAERRLVLQLDAHLGAASAGRGLEAHGAGVVDVGVVASSARRSARSDGPRVVSASHSTVVPAGAFAFQCERRSPVTVTDSRCRMNRGRFSKSCQNCVAPPRGLLTVMLRFVRTMPLVGCPRWRPCCGCRDSCCARHDVERRHGEHVGRREQRAAAVVLRIRHRLAEQREVERVSGDARPDAPSRAAASRVSRCRCEISRAPIARMSRALRSSASLMPQSLDMPLGREHLRQSESDAEHAEEVGETLTAGAAVLVGDALISRRGRGVRPRSFLECRAERPRAAVGIRRRALLLRSWLPCFAPCRVMLVRSAHIFRGRSSASDGAATRRSSRARAQTDF